ncbi:hypothetical protein D3C81_1955190 [compost metagenome]
MKRLILAAAMLALAGCEVAPNNQLNALDIEFCHKERLDAEMVTIGFFVKEQKVLCVQPKLTTLERLDFMTWLEQRKDRFEAKQKVTQ